MKMIIRIALMVVSIVLGGAFGLLITSNEPRVEAQGPPPCVTPNPSINGKAGTWAPNQDVIVNLNPSDFNAGEIECLTRAFNNWNANNGANGNNSGVYFRVTSSTNSVATLNASNQAISSTLDPSFQINR